MSRRVPNHPRRTPPDNNPYQGTTIPVHSNAYHASHHQQQYQQRCSHNGGKPQKPPTMYIGFSDETTDTYYDYYEQNGFQHSPLKESRNTDVTFSDDSGSTRLPYFEFEDESNKRYSRNTFSERSFRRHQQLGVSDKAGKDLRKIYPTDQDDNRLYHEIQTPCDNLPVSSNIPRRTAASRLSDRPQSSMSSGVTSAIVYGCGGKCQTFENVCYFFLQLVFTMGILIGVSLCIAGLVLRKSAARNLQVLVYIGVLLAMVSALLLGIQCNARSTARNRKKAILMAKRAPIPMETLHLRVNPLQQQQLMAFRESQRKLQNPPVHVATSRPLPQRPYRERQSPPVIQEEQGIPWWRRKDLSTR